MCEELSAPLCHVNGRFCPEQSAVQNCSGRLEEGFSEEMRNLFLKLKAKIMLLMHVSC